MKIKEFFITRYGPLRNEAPFHLANFNLFFGKNEEGKTLTIDALVKFLLGKDIKRFEYINRVTEEPVGYVILEDDKGREIKLPEKGDLTKVAGLTSSDCRNIFIIRNSELSIALESTFYTNVQDRLTGLRTEEILKIKNALREIGKVTESGTFRDTKEAEKLKTRIENAKDLIKKIKNLSERVKEKKFDELEHELVKYEEEINRISQEMENLEDARKREKYEKGKKAMNELKNCLERLKELAIYNEDDEQSWRDNERDIEKYNKEKKELFSELKEKEKDFKQLEKELNQEERYFRVLDERKKKINEEIKPELKDYETRSAELVLLKGRSKFFTLLGITSGILLGISLIGAIIRPSLLYYLSGGLFFILAIVSGLFKFQTINLESRLKKNFEKIKLALAKLELSGENITEILSNVQKFEEEHSNESNKLEEIRRNKGIIENEIKKLREKKIPEIQNKIEECEKQINNIKRKSGDTSLQKYIQKLKLKRELNELVEKQSGILESHFQKKEKTLEENIPYWEKEIENIKEYKERAKGIEYDENALSELKKKKQSLEKESGRLKNEMISFQEEMKDIGRGAYKILREEEGLPCKTLVDLQAIKDKLQEFINGNENNKDNVLKILKIFEEIEKEEQKKVSELFGKNSLVSKYFNEITGGIYSEVMLNQETKKIEVKRKNGAILEAEKLSGGAYDQLYLSIRLALGRNLLKDRKGFFIMDDPFIKADAGRLRRQIEILKKISFDLGWQIIYFTAKDEVKNALREDTKNNKVRYIEIPSIFS